MTIIMLDTDFCPNFLAGEPCECSYCASHEPCDECNGFRYPEELHEEHCSLAGDKVLQIKSRKRLLARIEDATAAHDYLDYDKSEILRARQDGLYLHAAQWLVDATGDPEVRELLKMVDPDGKLRDAEWDAYSESESKRDKANEKETEE